MRSTLATESQVPSPSTDQHILLLSCILCSSSTPSSHKKYQNHHHKLKPKLLSCSVLILKIEKNQKA